MNRLWRCLIHIPVGFMCGMWTSLGWFGIAGAYILFEGFKIYELNEDRHIKDQAWKDVFGFLIGLSVYYNLFIIKVGFNIF